MVACRGGTTDARWLVGTAMSAGPITLRGARRWEVASYDGSRRLFRENTWPKGHRNVQRIVYTSVCGLPDDPFQPATVVPPSAISFLGRLVLIYVGITPVSAHSPSFLFLRCDLKASLSPWCYLGYPVVPLGSCAIAKAPRWTNLSLRSATAKRRVVRCI